MKQNRLFDTYDLNDIDQYVIKLCFEKLSASGRISGFESLMERGGIGGDLNWGIQLWDEYTKEDHDIDKYFDGYLFYLGEEEYGEEGEGEKQVILSKEEMKPYIFQIVEWYKRNYPKQVNELIALATKNGFY